MILKDSHSTVLISRLLHAGCSVYLQRKTTQTSDESCEVLRHESRRNPQGLDYCLVEGYTDRMRKLCYKSCGYCKAPAPPSCSATEHGCCWDQVTTKQDRNGSNCERE